MKKTLKPEDLVPVRDLVTRTLRKYRSMPLLEISALTGLSDEETQEVVATLREQKSVSVKNPEDKYKAIVSLNGSFSPR